MRRTLRRSSLPVAGDDDSPNSTSGSRNAAWSSRGSRRQWAVTLAIFSDTCRNLIQVYQQNA
ncbi:hypothetical protein [Dokdonella sp.]|uniref:hypothetical protein n=1 Tax=Dokdonella sp. TaxID=2291710 RepID=UPI001B1BAB0B|nr:hypothetical protein [Dokdonella sp.]MBO9664099.1 hypothetical protein [Dokdonella sp.]